MNLLRVKFSNHLSFKEPQEVFFTGDDDDDEILPVTAVYGANASGKSNFIKVFRKLANYGDSGIIGAYQPFTLASKKEEDSSVELEFLISRQRYVLSIVFNSQEIKEERLIVYAGRTETVVYSRESDLLKEYDDCFISDIDKHEIEKRLKKRKGLVVENLLNVRRPEVFYEIRLFFDAVSDECGDFSKEHLEELYHDKELQKKIFEVMKASGFGMCGMKVYREKGVSEYEYKLDFMYSKDCHLPIEEESDGTQRYFAYLMKFVPAFLNGGVVVVDQLEKRLHRFAVRQIVKMFHDKDINKASAQLIFTTHDTNLLKPGTLEKDEIWFCEKDGEGCSEIYPLSEFKDIPDNYDYEKGYLNGKFGAVADLSTTEDLAKILK